MRPIGPDVLQDLVASEHLEPALLGEMPTFTVAEYEAAWSSSAPGDYDLVQVAFPDCSRYQCLLDPTSDACDD